MERSMRVGWFYHPLVMLFFASPSQGTGVPRDLNEFGLVCFCSSRVATPHMVIKYDNNGRLLFAARGGVTREELSALGELATDSQLQLLKDWGLLKERNGTLTTAFPVLEPQAMAALRARLEPIAAGIQPQISPHAGAIVTELDRRSRRDAAYALLFAYVLDGQVWDELKAYGKLPATEIAMERPYWAGTFWAVYPKQDSMPGTNTRSKGRAALKMLWTPRVVDQINALYGSRQTGVWLNALESGTSALPDLLPDAAAQPLVVREDADDPLVRHGKAIAAPVARAMLSTDLSAELPAADEPQRLLIGTHEMIWIILDRLVANHRIAQPDVLAKGAGSTADLAPLLIGVVSGRDRP